MDVAGVIDVPVRDEDGQPLQASRMIGHLIISLLVQLVVVAGTRNWWGGALTSAGWAISREITQAEYRWIEQFGGGHRANMPWWGGFDPAVWHKLDPWLDWIAPTLLASLIALAVTRHRRRLLG